MKNKCADTVADLLVDNIILRFGMPLVIHSNQGREFENGLAVMYENPHCSLPPRVGRYD